MDGSRQALSAKHGTGSPKASCAAGDFVCGRCTRARASQQVVADCGATLIVCPASILQQWQSEIIKHTQPGALKVITYLGQNKTSLESAMLKADEGHQRVDAGPIRKGKHSGQGVVSAQDLAAADVVLTTYDVLKRDVHHQADPDSQGKTFRTRKRYEVCRCCTLHATGCSSQCLCECFSAYELLSAGSCTAVMCVILNVKLTKAAKTLQSLPEEVQILVTTIFLHAVYCFWLAYAGGESAFMRCRRTQLPGQFLAPYSG